MNPKELAQKLGEHPARYWIAKHETFEELWLNLTDSVKHMEWFAHEILPAGDVQKKLLFEIDDFKSRLNHLDKWYFKQSPASRVDYWWEVDMLHDELADNLRWVVTLEEVEDALRDRYSG